MEDIGVSAMHVWRRDWRKDWQIGIENTRCSRFTLLLLLLQLLLALPMTSKAQSPQPSNRFNGDAAYQHLKRICEIGPRVSGTPAMVAQQEMLKKYFEQLGAHVSMQSFQVRHPLTGEAVTLKNIIVQWHLDRNERILLSAHYDTRPFPDEDPRNPRGRFIGANDGASGVAVLCELARHMPSLKSGYGVDFVLFDGEELVYSRRNEYFLGSNYFAKDYVANPQKYRYKFGVLLDMVGDKELTLYREINSMRYARQLTEDIWNKARELGVKEFIARNRHEVKDDHLPLNQVAKIPTCDIIDFDYPRPRARQGYWHTTQDTPDKCSANSLGKVGGVVLEWLRTLE